MSPRSLRILHVFRAPLGGLFRHVLDLTRAQAAKGHAVGFLCDADTGGERAEQVFAELRPHLALGVMRMPMRRDPDWTDLGALRALRAACRDLRPDALHGHGSKGGAYARLVISRALPATTIRAYTPHGGSFNYRPGTLVHRLDMGVEGVLARRTDLFLFESEYVAARFRRYVDAGGRLVRVVHNGVSDAEFAPIARSGTPRDLVYIGELRPAKGVEVLIDALALIHRAGRRLTLLVVGSGPSGAALQARAAQAGVADAVAFVPPRPIREAFACGRVMVIPSLAESLPYVILEAAAAAQPIVATNVGGIPEIFGPRADELIRPGDPEALAGAILAKLEQPEDERAAAARALSELVRARFTLDRMVDGVLSGYDAAITARGGLVRPAPLRRDPPLPPGEVEPAKPTG